MAQAAGPVDPAVVPTVTGVVESISSEQLVLKIPGSDYRLTLVPVGDLGAAVGDKLAGVVRAKSQRIDIVPAGGRYIEPVYGRPRRLQGCISGGNVSNNEIYVSAGPRIAITPMAPQRAGDFSIGQMISFDVEAGATFEPLA